jgi:hypothetical protein
MKCVLGKLVRLEHALEECDTIFQMEFAFLHSPQHQLVVRRRGGFEAGKGLVEIMVFNAQFL